jgi:Tol biopolymer transport system component
MKLLLPPVCLASALAAIEQPPQATGTERHLTNVRQLTFGGENAEAYFSTDGTRLIFQSTREGVPCDQMFTMKVDGSDVRRVSTGTGRTTCGYFYPDGKEIVFASTHETAPECPPKPSFSRGYVWPVYGGYDIYRANADGSGLKPLTRTPGYDAEATIAPDGLITFTSVRDGDMEIFTMQPDGSGVRRLTNRPGPDGGPFFSWDGKQIAFRARALGSGTELDEYRSLLKEALWRPTQLELFVMNRDGSNQRQVTKLTGANFAPSWHPNGKRLIFASNVGDPKGRNFDVYLVNVDGSGLRQLTFNETLTVPDVSHDGSAWCSPRTATRRRKGDERVYC